MLFQNGRGGPLWGYLSFGGFELPDRRDFGTEALTLRANLNARVFQWRKIADLPLTPGATASDEFGSWKLIAVNSATPGTQVFLERRQISLSTATDSRCSSAENGPRTRMALLLYDPQRHIARLPDPGSYNDEAARGTETALLHHYTSFSINQKLSADYLARARLIIFEKSWLGTVPETWKSPEFTMEEKLQPPGRNGFNQNPMPHTEFNRRVAALKVPAPDASRRDVGLYLLDFLCLVDAQRQNISADDPLVRQLAVFVPAHLDLMLDGLPVVQGPSKRCILDAIKLGAAKAQKTAIITALQSEPDLAEVLLARGWVNDTVRRFWNWPSRSGGCRCQRCGPSPGSRNPARIRACWKNSNSIPAWATPRPFVRPARHGSAPRRHCCAPMA